MKTIEVKCTGNDSKSLDELVALQGELKTLPEANYEKLKGRILDFGFLEPITIWRDRNEILNGHQRVTTLRKMRDDGYSIPQIPVNSITVKDREEAKRIILSLTSQYGVMTEGSLAEFMQEADIVLEEIVKSYEFAGIDGDVLEGAIQSLQIDDSYVEKFEDEASKFEEVIGKPTGKKKHLLLYVEFEKESDFDRIQEIMCDKKTRQMNVEKFMAMVSAYQQEKNDIEE